MAFPFLLLAAQAAGIATNLYAERSQQRFERTGERLTEAQIGLRMNQEQLANTEQTLYQTEQLRETLASQRAIFAARGQSVGSGSARAITEKSMRAFSQDQQARSISQGFRKHQLESNLRLMNIGTQARQSRRAGRRLLQTMQTFDFNSIFGAALTSPKSNL